MEWLQARSTGLHGGHSSGAGGQSAFWRLSESALSFLCRLSPTAFQAPNPPSTSPASAPRRVGRLDFLQTLWVCLGFSLPSALQTLASVFQNLLPL